jgi:hypothetical protein
VLASEIRRSEQRRLGERRQSREEGEPELQRDLSVGRRNERRARRDGPPDRSTHRELQRSGAKRADPRLQRGAKDTVRPQVDAQTEVDAFPEAMVEAHAVERRSRPDRHRRPPVRLRPQRGKRGLRVRRDRFEGSADGGRRGRE